MIDKTYNTLAELLVDYEEVKFGLAKKGQLIVTHPNMFTGSNENVLSVARCSSNMKYIYARIVKPRKKP